MEMSIRRPPGDRGIVFIPPVAAVLTLLACFVLNAEHVWFAAFGLLAYATLCWMAPFSALLTAIMAMPLAPRISFAFGNLYVATVLVLVFEGVTALRKLAGPSPLGMKRGALATPLVFLAAVLMLSTAMNMGHLIANPDQLLRFIQFLSYLALYFFAVDLSLTPSQRRWTIGLVLATGVVEAGIAVYQWYARRGFFATGTFDGQHNHLAAYLVFTGLLFVGLLIEARSARTAALALACIALAALGLVFSFSRTGYVAIAVGMLFFTVLRIPPRKKLLVLAVLVAGGISAYHYVPSSVAARFGTIAVVAAGQTERDISFSERLGMWTEAFEAFKRSPLLGTGAMTFQVRDNYFMKTLGEAGALGVFALLWMILAVLRETMRSLRFPAEGSLVRGARVGMAAASFALLIVFNTAGDFVNLHRLMGVYWVLLAVLTCRADAGTEESGRPKRIVPGAS
jgi:O-antigen ligase